MRADPPARRELRSRHDRPVWRQAVEGIGLVVVLAAGVTAIGAAMALVVSLLF